jgi:hypothetical protein
VDGVLYQGKKQPGNKKALQAHDRNPMSKSQRLRSNEHLQIHPKDVAERVGSNST